MAASGVRAGAGVRAGINTPFRSTMQFLLPFEDFTAVMFDGLDLSAPVARFELLRVPSDAEAAQMWLRGGYDWR